jgi:hypothetical protein
VNKSAIKIIQQRDFLEKKLKFNSKDGSKKYILYSSTPDELKAPDASISRAYTVVGLHQFEVLDDKRVKLTCLMQTDFNLPGTMGKIGSAAVLNQLPKGLKSWFLALSEYV